MRESSSALRRGEMRAAFGRPKIVKAGTHLLDAGRSVADRCTRPRWPGPPSHSSTDANKAHGVPVAIGTAGILCISRASGLHVRVCARRHASTCRALLAASIGNRRVNASAALVEIADASGLLANLASACLRSGGGLG